MLVLHPPWGHTGRLRGLQSLCSSMCPTGLLLGVTLTVHMQLHTKDSTLDACRQRLPMRDCVIVGPGPCRHDPVHSLEVQPLPTAPSGGTRTK